MMLKPLLLSRLSLHTRRASRCAADASALTASRPFRSLSCPISVSPRRWNPFLNRVVLKDWSIVSWFACRQAVPIAQPVTLLRRVFVTTIAIIYPLSNRQAAGSSICKGRVEVGGTVDSGGVSGVHREYRLLRCFWVDALLQAKHDNSSQQKNTDSPKTNPRATVQAFFGMGFVAESPGQIPRS